MALLKADVEQLMNQAKVQLVGSSENGLKATFYDVLTEFLNDSSIWTEAVPIQVVPGTYSYSATAPEGQIIRLVGVNDSDGNFVAALMPRIGVVDIKHAPNSATTYYAHFVLNTALPTSRESLPIAPDWILPIWHTGILAGILGQMMAQPNKSYANPAQSVYHLKRFRDAIARARVSKLRANTNGAQAWRFPQSFRSNGQQGGVPSIGTGNERTFG